MNCSWARFRPALNDKEVFLDNAPYAFVCNNKKGFYRPRMYPFGPVPPEMRESLVLLNTRTEIEEQRRKLWDNWQDRSLRQEGTFEEQSALLLKHDLLVSFVRNLSDVHKLDQLNDKSAQWTAFTGREIVSLPDTDLLCVPNPANRMFYSIIRGNFMLPTLKLVKGHTLSAIKEPYMLKPRNRGKGTVKQEAEPQEEEEEEEEEGPSRLRQRIGKYLNNQDEECLRMTKLSFAGRTPNGLYLLEHEYANDPRIRGSVATSIRSWTIVQAPDVCAGTIQASYIRKSLQKAPTSQLAKSENKMVLLIVLLTQTDIELKAFCILQTKSSNHAYIDIICAKAVDESKDLDVFKAIPSKTLVIDDDDVSEQGRELRSFGSLMMCIAQKVTFENFAPGVSLSLKSVDTARQYYIAMGFEVEPDLFTPAERNVFDMLYKNNHDLSLRAQVSQILEKEIKNREEDAYDPDGNFYTTMTLSQKRLEDSYQSRCIGQYNSENFISERKRKSKDARIRALVNRS